jgi:hypothetical protein
LLCNPVYVRHVDSSTLDLVSHHTDPHSSFLSLVLAFSIHKTQPIPAHVVVCSETPEKSGDRFRGKQSRDTSAEDALQLETVLQLQTLHHTHREPTRLFLMVARRRGLTPRVKLHILNNHYSPETGPLLLLWKPFLRTTGAELGVLTGRS